MDKNVDKTPKSKKKVAKAAPKKRERAEPKAERTTVGLVTSVFPRQVREAKYVARTIEILEDRERKGERLNAQTKKKLGNVAKDIRGDVTAVFDRWLGRVGLQRKAVA